MHIDLREGVGVDMGLFESMTCVTWQGIKRSKDIKTLQGYDIESRSSIAVKTNRM
jgi:hypothetical protein